MRRWITIILLCLLLGAVINIAVAWGLAIQLSPPDSITHNAGPTYRIVCRRFQSFDLFYLRTCGASKWVIVDSSARSLWLGEDISTTSQIQWDMPASIAEMLQLDRESLPCPKYKSKAVISYGLPFQSMVALKSTRGLRKQWPVGWVNTREEYNYGIRLSNNIIVPILPIPALFVANWTLYAAIVALVYLGFRSFTFSVRRRRGRCPKCAYDLRHDLATGCPECGWRRSDVITE